MACRPSDVGKTPTRLGLVAASQNIVSGDLLVNSSGYLALAAGGGGVPIVAVAAQNLASADVGTEFLVYDVNESIKYVCDTDGVPTQAQMNAPADLASKNTIDEDASTDDIFHMDSIVGAAADQKVKGYFVRSAYSA